jgi:hypothetical protein
MTDAPSTVDAPWPVGLLSNKIRAYIDRLGTAWVEGEITQWGVSGGNVYGKLKDLTEDATISFTIWSSVRGKLPEDLKQGDRVIALIKPNYWAKGGSLTMQVFEMRHVGLGDLLERLERLRKQLASEGLFELSRKKRLPFLPHCIGLITGKDSDAEKDVLRNAQLRWPAVHFKTVHTAVQGDRVVTEVTAAIRRLDADPEVDVIIVARGGGDFQNLLGCSEQHADRKRDRARSGPTTPRRRCRPARLHPDGCRQARRSRRRGRAPARATGPNAPRFPPDAHAPGRDRPHRPAAYPPGSHRIRLDRRLPRGRTHAVRRTRVGAADARARTGDNANP